MKALQQTWDQIGAPEAARQAQQEALGRMSQQNNVIRNALGVTLPWQISTVNRNRTTVRCSESPP